MITITPICYKYKSLKNGEYPLKIRLCENKQVKYINLDISIKLIYWDFNNHCLKPDSPNKELIDKLITDKISNIHTKILEFKSFGKEYTINTIINSLTTIHPKTVHELFIMHMDTLKKSNRLNYMLSVKRTYTCLLKFNGHLNIYFSDINITWLKRYEIYMRNKNLSSSTIGIRFRTLRMMYNLAIELDIVKPELYPFKKFKLSKFSKSTNKRAITKQDIELIINYNTNNDFYKQLAVDIFTFSYYIGGINFNDIARLSTNNVQNNRLIYYRKKTGKLINLPIHPIALKCISKYKNSDYLFPILSEFHKTEQQKANRIHKTIDKVNRELKSIGKELNLPIKLTTYVARHSYATVLKKAGVSTAIISETLGHSSEKVTQHYLDSFENEQINEALKNL